jgi:hypothetical protein
MDHRLIGSSSWARVIAGDPGPERLVAGNKFGEPAKLDTVSRENFAFEAACRSDRFVVTVEVAPPDSPDPAALLERARNYEGLGMRST